MVIERCHAPEHAPEPPAMRALAHAAVSEADKARLRAMLTGADPVPLPAEMRAAQAESGERVDERGMGAGRGAVPAAVDSARFAASLRVAWSEGERRPTHRRRYIRRKPLVRPSVLDSVRERIVARPDEQPSPTAVAVLERLREIGPERFKPGHGRTVQRFVKARRATMAREVPLGTPPPTITSELTAEAARGMKPTASERPVTSRLEATRGGRFRRRVTTRSRRASGGAYAGSSRSCWSRS